MVQQVGERQCRQSLLPDIPTEGRVPVVLDSIVCSATNVFSNVCPLVAKLTEVEVVRKSKSMSYFKQRYHISSGDKTGE